jgi:hypothetical protein
MIYDFYVQIPSESIKDIAICWLFLNVLLICLYFYIFIFMILFEFSRILKWSYKIFYFIFPFSIYIIIFSDVIIFIL